MVKLKKLPKFYSKEIVAIVPYRKYMGKDAFGNDELCFKRDSLLKGEFDVEVSFEFNKYTTVEYDPIFYRTFGGIVGSVLSDEYKQLIADKYNFKLNMLDSFNEDKDFIYPEFIPRQIVIDTPENSPENTVVDNTVPVTKVKFKKTTDVCRRECHICGVLYEVTRSSLSANRSVYCGKACANTARATANKDGLISNKCHYCGVEYTSIVSEDFCSIECEREFDKNI